MIFKFLFYCAASLSAFAEAPSVSPETSLKWLVNGNARFSKSYLRQDGQSGADIARLSRAQHPHAVVLACSDSRMPPELVFDQKLGELFTIRNGGPTLDENTIKSVEYGVSQGARLIVVMGHAACGMLPAAGKQEWANAEAIVRDLIRHSPLVGKKWAAGELWIVPSLYDLSSGKVAFRENLANESKRAPTSIR